MADYFLDSSAVVKRYIDEPGSVFVDRMVGPEQENNIFIAQITRVEVSSAFARRRKGRTLAEQDAATALGAFTRDLADVYVEVAVTDELVGTAADLASKHALRAYDAVQLAAAMAANRDLTESGVETLTFVSADGDLNSAAFAEGLKVENPDDYQ